jgi:polar amino acid transport system substrate-binding protein
LRVFKRQRQSIMAGLLWLALSNTVAADLKKIVLCTDDNFWHPFIFVQEGKIGGLHVDIIDGALMSKDYTAEYKPMAWAACQDAARLGTVDGIAVISYEPSRAEYLLFPADADNTAQKSPWRISQADYLVVTSHPDTPRISRRNPQFRDVPGPIRMIASYALVNDFQQKDIFVDQSTQREDLYQKLMTEKRGSVIDLAEEALRYATKPAYAGRLFINPTPIDSKSYFVAFSKKSNISADQAKAIWLAIVQERQNKEKTPEWLGRY